jgi:crotonobetainyl-CoA:carnitine CoA-transferase CaiB-like acyl-CoA transferase
MSWTPRPELDGPLAGLRVLDFSALLPGPFATQILADLGAEWFMVERPEGDEARQFPSGLYATANRNKRSVVANLKDAADRAACLRLAAEADVVVEGFRPGVAARLGIGYDDARALRPDVVYCSLSGFGQTGPYRDKPGHDLTFLALSGGLSYSAHWGERPRRSGVPVGDMAGATYATIAILAALRERDRTGRGCYLDAAIADATMAFVSPRGGPSFAVANEHRFGVYATNDLYTAGDGETLAVCAVEEKFWTRLRGVLAEFAPGVADPRFDSEDGRRRHGDDLKALIQSALAQRGADLWAAIFEELDVAVERVVTLAEAARSPHAAARGVVAEADGEEQVVFPVLRDGEAMGRFRFAAPALGAHTAELFGELPAANGGAP